MLPAPPPPPREEIAHIFFGIRGLAGVGPQSRGSGEKRVPTPVRSVGIWGMLEGGWRGVSAGAGQAQGRERGWKDGFNQLDLIGMKKKILFPKWRGRPGREVLAPGVPQNRPWGASALLVSLIPGDLGIPGAQRRIAGALRHSPSPSKTQENPQTPLKIPIL